MAYYKFTQTGQEIQLILDNIQDIQKDISHTTDLSSNLLASWIKYFAENSGKIAKIVDAEGSELSNINKIVTLPDFLLKTGGTVSGNLQFDGLVYLENSTPFLLSKQGKIGLRATNELGENLGQINISNAWYDANHYGANMNALNKQTGKYNSIRVSHNGPQYIGEDSVEHNLATEDFVNTKIGNIEDALAIIIGD